MGRTSHNPFAFTPLPVTIITTIVYCAVLIPIIVVHHLVPPAPSSLVSGLNVSEAWLDLKFLSNGFHPYNSHRNDIVRNWLIQRLDEILTKNNVSYATCEGVLREDTSCHKAGVVIFNDLSSNLSFSSPTFGATGIGTYFEGTNIIVYIRGSEDSDFDWRSPNKRHSHGGVLVNAHYDSVSTGYGATDDGVGIVSVLQLIKFFSHPGNQPKRGIVALLNNGEEDFLNGARAFAMNPISSFPHTFVNLEGAGAGGKATLFRSTDAEVTRFYDGTQYPYGAVVSSDGFKQGLIRSDTDYSVFYGNLGMRGLDIAFFEPRARYHTDQDDARHTSIDSLWHMLSAALHSVQGLAMDQSSTFEGEASSKGKVNSGSGSNGVYFDIFGRAFAAFELHTLFALSVTLLVAAPIALIAVSGVLSHCDKLYVFSLSVQNRDGPGDQKIRLGGIRGFFRYPIIFVVASAATIGSAFLLVKQNSFIVYSSPYSVWSMMISVWLWFAWFTSRAIGFVRPTALHRLYALLWMFFGGWALLVVATVYEQQSQIASGYLVVIYFASIALSTLIAFCEQFGLETKKSFAAEQGHHEETRARRSERPGSAGTGENNEEAWAEEATESTSLLGSQRRTTFANYNPSSPSDPRHTESAIVEDEEEAKFGPVYGNEQKWSRSFPAWTWLLQLLTLVPVPLIIVGGVALQTITGTSQTLADGNSALIVYLLMAIFSILIIAPIGPFVHRYTYHIPLFIFGVLVGTLVYNLVAFPFSGNSRLKVYFKQKVDLDSGMNTVTLSGIDGPYIKNIIGTLPSAAGETLDVDRSGRLGLLDYSWAGLPPKVVPNTQPGVPPLVGYGQWLAFNASRDPGSKEARIVVAGKNTRSCILRFNSPVSSFYVEGSATDDRFPRKSDTGTTEIRLWSREWEKPWNMTFEWDREEGIGGRVVCLWNDEDGLGLIPALEEVKRFAPDWATISKFSDGLVEGSKVFNV
ncbi:hypothetical protein MMC10_008329 [Thelotrema lepadinum]|nr:hypothetical protein [Thelotrema lepadinum]